MFLPTKSDNNHNEKKNRMSIERIASINGNEVTLEIKGNFDATIYDDFKMAFSDTLGTVKTYEVDLSGVTYMDSTALGFLIMLRDHAGSIHANIKVCNPSEYARNKLKKALFHNIFEITP